jgi:plasmid stabilization system protein ParE
VHVLYYRAVTAEIVEIVRILHEPVRHIDPTSKAGR